RRPLRPGARARRILRDPQRRAGRELRDVLPDQLDVRARELVEERRRRLFAVDGDLDLPHDWAGVGGGVDDLEERDPGLREAAEDRPGDRGPAPVTGQQRRVHAEDAARGEGEYLAAHELRPTDHEDRVGPQRAYGLDR